MAALGAARPRARSRRRAGAGAVLVVLCGAPRSAEAGDGGAPLQAELSGSLPPRSAVVRVTAARVLVAGPARRQQGVAVGFAAFDEVSCEVTVRSGLDHAVRDVEVQVNLLREAPGGSVRGERERAADEEDEATAEPAGGGGAAIAGWKVVLSIGELPPMASRTRSCRQALPAVGGDDRPTAAAELTFSAEVTGYRVPGLPLSRAWDTLRRGAPADQRSVFTGYGEAIHGDARAYDEQILLGLLGSSPSRQARMTSADLLRGEGTPRTPLEFAFLLQASRRIGGQPTLEGLVMHEAQLVAHAPPLPPRRDEAHPADNADLLPDSVRTAVHETIVEVAHHNLAGLYLILHAPPPPPPVSLVEPARRLAESEGLGDPDSWLEAAAAEPLAFAQYNPDTDREGRLPILPILGRYGGDEVVPTLARVLDSEDLELRREAAAALAGRGQAGLALLVGALDTDDERRRAPVRAALLAAPDGDRTVLETLARGRGVEGVDAHPGPAALVQALEALLAAGRARAVDERLAEALALADRDPLSPRIDALLGEARGLSPSAYRAPTVRHTLARIAARVYRGRTGAARPDAAAALAEVSALGPVDDPEFQAVLRDARAAEARRQSRTDLDGALRLLAQTPGGAPDPVLQAVAAELVLARIDAALARRDRMGAERLLSRARELGVDPAQVEDRARRLSRLRLWVPLTALAVLCLVVAPALAAWLLRRRRAARESARGGLPPRPGRVR